MGKIIRHRDEILRGFAKDVHDKAVDDQTYKELKDIVMLEVLCDIRDNLHFIAGNIRDFGYESDED